MTQPTTLSSGAKGNHAPTLSRVAPPVLARLAVGGACLGLVCAAWAASVASAGFPGQNGKIAYSSGDDIFVRNADGSGPTNLTTDATTAREPAWSPDGQRIAFDSNRGVSANDEIVAMNADGSAQTNLTNNAAVDQNPAWSPDGQKIAFESDRDFDPGEDIYAMNANGSSPTRLTDDSGLDIEAAWSPDGQKIAFSSTRDGNQEIYVMNADGSAETNLSNHAGGDFLPNWSPDGQKIAFTSSRDGNSEIYVMNANGSAQTNLTNDAAADIAPAWSPDGQKITFQRGTEIYVMNADGSAQTNLTNTAAADRAPDWQPLVTQCSDGTDNDGDALIDLADPGCSSDLDDDETDPLPASQCTDNADNDGDGLIDLVDPGCSSAADNDETDPADVIPPETTIAQAPGSVVKTRKRKARVTFGFTSSELGSTFRCTLDGAVEPCASPKEYKLRRGAHVFEVQAIDPAGNLDPTPATHSFKVKRKR